MTPDAAGIEAALAAGLAAHAGYEWWPMTREFICTCEASLGTFYPDPAHRAHVAAALLPVVTQAQAEALREAAQVWRGFVADGRCPTCQMGRSRETVGMVCQTCGTDYARADESGGAS